MRLRPPTLLVLVIVAACRDGKHPRQLVGTWARDSVYGGFLRGTDTLRLTSDGIMLRSGGTMTTDAATHPLKPTTYAEGLKWAYRPLVEGPLLCFFVAEGQEADCHTVQIAAESAIVVDGRSYRRLPN